MQSHFQSVNCTHNHSIELLSVRVYRVCITDASVHPDVKSNGHNTLRIGCMHVINMRLLLKLIIAFLTRAFEAVAVVRVAIVHVCACKNSFRVCAPAYFETSLCTRREKLNSPVCTYLLVYGRLSGHARTSSHDSRPNNLP